MLSRDVLARAGAVAGLVLACDELLKMFVRARLAVCDPHGFAACERLDLLGPLRLVRTENAGSALGYAQGWQLWLVLAAVGLLLIPLYGRRLRRASRVAPVAMGLQVGGAAGNLLDRLLLGGATDMLSGGPGLVWNLADVALVVGTLMSTWALLRPSAEAAPSREA